MATDHESRSSAARAPNRQPGDPGDPADPSDPGPGYPSAVFKLDGLADGKVLPEPRLDLPSLFSISVQTNDNPVGNLTINSDHPQDVFAWTRSQQEGAEIDTSQVDASRLRQDGAFVAAIHRWSFGCRGSPQRRCRFQRPDSYIGRATGSTGFTGALDELRIYSVALGAEDVRQLAVDHHATLSETPVADFHSAAYEALLAGLGTPFEEMRTLKFMAGDQREALAKRLGLWIGETGDPDRLASLLPVDWAAPPGTRDFERWLATDFGLPMTIEFEAPVTIPPYVLAMRQITLTRQRLQPTPAP